MHYETYPHDERTLLMKQFALVVQFARMDSQSQFLQPLVQFDFRSGCKDVRFLVGQAQLEAQLVPPHISAMQDEM